MKTIGHLAQTRAEGPYSMRNGLCFFFLKKGKVVVPSLLCIKHLHEAHDTKMGGHSSMLHTFKHLGQQFYWPSMFYAIGHCLLKNAKYVKRQRHKL